eukprot:m.1017693 g.1017693  ORF g.1017693 m.1017693 type:complete len:401 (+) comp24084_c0_seq50:137-1339(+)
MAAAKNVSLSTAAARQAAKQLLVESPSFSWASELAKHKPPFRLPLAQKPTPIEPWFLPCTNGSKFSVHIKRDDNTGGLLSGNKIRKLEYLLGDALHKGCDTVFTCGGVQSNHCRTTAVAARRCGFDVRLFLRASGKSAEEEDIRGNLLIDQYAGAHCYLVPKVTYATGLLPRMEHLREHLITTESKNPYIIPVGGSNCVGVWGYLEAYNELLEQGLRERFDDIVLATGSGGTAAGLAIANALCGGPVDIHAIAVCDDPDYFYGHIDETIQELGLYESHGWRARDLIHVVDGFKGRGYGLSTPTELQDLYEVSTATGVVLDPVYTGKGYLGLKHLLENDGCVDGRRLRGERVLFLHTGGAFGNFDGRFENKEMTAGVAWHLLPFDSTFAYPSDDAPASAAK